MLLVTCISELCIWKLVLACFVHTRWSFVCRFSVFVYFYRVLCLCQGTSDGSSYEQVCVRAHAVSSIWNTLGLFWQLPRAFEFLLDHFHSSVFFGARLLLAHGGCDSAFCKTRGKTPVCVLWPMKCAHVLFLCAGFPHPLHFPCS